MPPLAEIQGWRAYIYAKDHELPHFHLRKSGVSVSIDIMTGMVLEGELPRHLLREIQAWLDAHRQEVLGAWSTVRDGRLPSWIE